VANLKSKNIPHHYPDHSRDLSRLRKISGQVQGIERMIHDKRYCSEITQQIRAAASALKALEIGILTVHLNQCLKEATLSREPEPFQRKISELVRLIRS
jgi:DNA-binding FrmR family transcriptional regulator